MSDEKGKFSINRRGLIKGIAAAGAGLAMPHIWVPRDALAQSMARGEAKHVILIRLNGGFRFTAAFNGEVDGLYNPFGRAENKAAGAEWGVSKLLEQAGWLGGADGEARKALGMKPVNEIADKIAVLPCVDHEPTSGSADGNHGTGLERYLTGYVGGDTSILTMINYGLRERYEAALAAGETVLPAFSLGNSGMSRGSGQYAAYRPPVLSGGFDRFGFNADENLPDWSREMSAKADERMRDRQHPTLRAPVDAYIQTRDATRRYSAIFNDDLLKIGSRSEQAVDGVTNVQLAQMFGNSGAAQSLRLALRLFHFGCPAVYLDQGGYDMHSGEENGLPPRMSELNQLISALVASLKLMDHPSGGKYWDHTLVALGSEFGRSTRGQRFNSARGSDHGGDYATRWMSMPVFGGPIEAAGNGGRSFGGTRASDLKALDKVYSYRALMKTLMDALGCDHREFFPADRPFNDLFA
jgi:hypothetical protein